MLVVVLIVSLAMLGAQLWLRPSVFLWSRQIFYLTAVAMFSVLLYESYSLYSGWEVGSLGQYLLPPHQGWGYFLSYVGWRFWAPWITALIAALLIPIVARKFNKKYGERFFYEEEFGLMRLGTFLVGWPGFLLYIPLVLFSGTIFSAMYGALGRGRAPLRYLWMPIAVFVIIVETWLIPKEMLAFFNF